MNDQQKAKIDRFLQDKVMSNAVYEVIRGAFLKNKGQRDIQVLAAERLAIDLLEDSWKELRKYEEKALDDGEKPKNVGF